MKEPKQNNYRDMWLQKPRYTHRTDVDLQNTHSPLFSEVHRIPLVTCTITIDKTDTHNVFNRFSSIILTNGENR